MALVYTSVAADVQPRVAGRTLTTTSKPTIAQAEQWLTEGEAALLGTLRGAGIAIPDAETEGGHIITAWVAPYAEGLVRIAWDYSTADDDGQAKVDAFWELLDKIKADPSFYDGMLNGGSSGDESSRVKAYVLSNADDKTITDGDFDPVFDDDRENDW